MFIVLSWKVVLSDRWFIIEYIDRAGQKQKISSFTSVETANDWAKENIRLVLSSSMKY